MKTQVCAWGIIIGLVVAMSVSICPAAPIATITDEDSTASFDLGGGTGMYSWAIGDVEHLAQQWFWYRVGSTGGERAIDTLGSRFHGTTDANFDGDHETLYVRYEDGQLRVTVMFVLNGAEPGNPSADIAESIQITNLTSGTMDLHFFQFGDFDLGGTATDESVRILDARGARQEDIGFYASEVVLTPRADHWQADSAQTIFSNLNDGLPTTLTDAAGPVGPGDLGWAFQWDRTLRGGESFLISEDKQIVPEPITMSLIAVGGVVLLRRKK